MPCEIERKFLVDSDKLPKLPIGKRLIQGYLNPNTPTVRVRTSDNDAYITIKGGSGGTISRSEFEYEIPYDDALELFRECSGLIITKMRYEIVHAGHTWELDIFDGENNGLIVAEIELLSEDEEFFKPAWITKEVSYERKYTNAALSQIPFSEW